MSKFAAKRSRGVVKRTLNRLSRASVTKKTATKYRRELEEMDDFLRVRGHSKMTMRRFEDFVAGLHEQGRAGSTAAGYRSAWKFHLETTGHRVPSERKFRRVNRAIAGMSYRAGAAPVMPRGAMDSGMLMQLRFHCAVNGFTMEADAFALKWHGMVRHGQLPGLRVCDARMLAEKGAMIHLPKKKAYSARACKAVNRSHFKHVANCAGLLKHVIKGKRGNDLVFPGWCAARARDLIKEAAIVFRWDNTVKWDGPHTMRHGASQEGLACTENPVKSIMRRATWAAASTAARYMKPRGRGYMKPRGRK